MIYTDSMLGDVEVPDLRGCPFGKSVPEDGEDHTLSVALAPVNAGAVYRGQVLCRCGARGPRVDILIMRNVTTPPDAKLIALRRSICLWNERV